MVDPLDGSLLNRFSSVEVEANFVFMQLIGNESETSEHGQHDGKCGTSFYYIHTHSLYHTQHVARCVQQIFVPRMLFFFYLYIFEHCQHRFEGWLKAIKSEIAWKLLHHCPNRIDQLKNCEKLINSLVAFILYICGKKRIQSFDFRWSLW